MRIKRPVRVGGAVRIAEPKEIKAATMTQENAAKFLGVSVGTLRKWQKEGVVPVVKIGGRYLYSETTLTKWLEEKAAPGAGQVSPRSLDA